MTTFFCLCTWPCLWYWSVDSVWLSMVPSRGLMLSGAGANLVFGVSPWMYTGFLQIRLLSHKIHVKTNLTSWMLHLFWLSSNCCTFDFKGGPLVGSFVGVCCGLCNPSKWEADIWGWVEVRRSAILHYTVNQHLHWACRQYGYTGGTRGWLGVERWQLCLRGYISQLKVPSASSSGSLGFIVCEHTLRSWINGYTRLVSNLLSKRVYPFIQDIRVGAWPNFLDQLPSWYCIASPLLQTNKDGLCEQE